MAKKVSRYAWTMNKAEQLAVLKLWRRDHGMYSLKDRGAYREFRKRFKYSSLNGCWLGQVFKITIGIEEDGYTHS